MTPAFARPSTERERLIPSRFEWSTPATGKCSVATGTSTNSRRRVVPHRPGVHTADCRILKPGGRRRSGASERSTGRQSGAAPTTAPAMASRRAPRRRRIRYRCRLRARDDRKWCPVKLVGDSAAVTPIDGVSTARDSDTVTVTTGRHGDGERPADATFSLTRTDSASERVLAEQVMASARFAGRPGGLRNALPS